MECYCHEVPARYVCMGCGRGLCKECLTVGRGGQSVCSADCERRLYGANKASLLTVQKTIQAIRVNVFMTLIFGGLFLAFGILEISTAARPLAAFMFVMGAGFLFLSVRSYRHLKKDFSADLRGFESLGEDTDITIKGD